MLKINLLVQSITVTAVVIVGMHGTMLPTPANPTPALGRQPQTAPKAKSNNAPKTQIAGTGRIAVETVSGTAEIELAEYLAANDIKFYGAYWCSHCKEQKSLFGAVAASKLAYVECAADGENSQRQLCKDKNIQMFPTWVIKGQLLPGTRDLKQLAELTGYQGATNFKYKKK